MHEDRTWGVFVRWDDKRRGEWLTPNGHTTTKRIHASMNHREDVEAALRADIPPHWAVIPTNRED